MGIGLKSYSQYYSNPFILNYQKTISDNYTLVDNKIFANGLCPDTSNSSGIALKSYILKLDNYGQIISSNTYRPNNFLKFQSTSIYGKSKYLKNKIINVGLATDTGTYARNYLVCFYDTNCTLSNYFSIPTLSTQGGLTNITFTNNHYYATGSKNSTRQAILLKIDTFGNKIRELNYNILSVATNNLAQTIIAVDSGDLMMVIGGYKEYPDWGEHYKLTYKTTFIRTDSLGGQKWQWTDTSNNGQAAYSFQKTSDGGYISCGSYVGTRVLIREVPSGVLLEDYATFHPYIVKWNSDFTKQWEKCYDKADSMNTGGEFFDIKETNDGNFISCGYGGQTIGTRVINGGWLQKTDRNGDVIWRKFYKPYGHDTSAYFFRLYDLDIASNGDIIAVGEYNPTLGSGLIPQQGWLLRVDSNGCIVDSNWCGWSSVEVEPVPTPSPPEGSGQEGNWLRVYPNPASDIINIEVSRFKYQDIREVKFEIYDAIGNNVIGLCHSEARGVYDGEINYQLNINELSSGIYFIRILDEDNKVIGNGKFIKE
jgi:hypothetical protein